MLSTADGRLSTQSSHPLRPKAVIVRPAKAGASSGGQPHRGKSRSPVAWVAGLQLGNRDSEAYRRAIVRMAASHQAVAQANESRVARGDLTLTLSQNRT